MPKAIVLIKPPHDPNAAGPFFGYLLGEGWDVHAFSDQGDVPDDVAADAEFLIAPQAPVGAELIARCPKLRLIQVPAHGYENVSVADATRAGVPVATIASSGAEAHTVAEMAILLAGVASRKVLLGHASLRAGSFGNVELLQAGVFELAGKTFGIVGLGRIGRELAKRARAFDMRVLYHDAFRLAPQDEETIGVAYRTLDELLTECDFISLHVPETPQTTGLIAARELGLMKPEAILINTSRGAVVDHDALVDALRERRIRGAALDVFEPEPPPADDPLLQLDNVVLSPHMAGVTAESVIRILQAAAANCHRVARGEDPLDVVTEGSPH